MRCFVAIQPPTETAGRIERFVDTICDAVPKARRIATGNLHLTLAFIGPLATDDARRVAAAIRALDKRAFPPITWTLDRIGRFERARVLWVGSDSNPVLDDCADAVRSELKQLGVSFDPQPFVAHVTVLRDVRRDTPMPQARISVPWPLSGPCLMQSISTASGVRYELVE